MIRSPTGVVGRLVHARERGGVMGTLTRKQFLKGSAIGAAALAATATGRVGLASADEGGHVSIHFHGVLARGAATVAISIDVAGQKDALVGAGWDSGTA